jgi:hypothetical protein
MKLFLYIQITEKLEEVKFYNPVISFLKEQNTELTIYDLDNHSDTLIVSYVNKLISDSEKAIIYIEVTPEGNFKNLMPLLTNSLDNPDHIQFILQGNNARLEKILSILAYLKIQENTRINPTIEAIIKQFF